MILLTETDEDDMEDGKDHILEMFCSKSHYISIRVLFGKKSACLDVSMYKVGAYDG